MKQSRYRLFRRGQTFYSHDNQTGRQESLRTSNRVEALKLVLAKNDTHNHSYLNLALGRTYLNAHDPTLITRTWDQVMEQMMNNGTRESTRARARCAFQNVAFDEIRAKKLCETVTDDFLRVLNCGLVSVNHYPERWAQVALGHNSRAVHHAYAKRAQVVVPSLESYEHSELRTASVAAH